jgi:hypothetical protein
MADIGEPNAFPGVIGCISCDAMPRPRNAVRVMITLPGARRQVATAPVGIASKTAPRLVVAHIRRRHLWSSIKLFELSFHFSGSERLVALQREPAEHAAEIAVANLLPRVVR